MKPDAPPTEDPAERREARWTCVVGILGGLAAAAIAASHPAPLEPVWRAVLVAQALSIVLAAALLGWAAHTPRVVRAMYAIAWLAALQLALQALLFGEGLRSPTLAFCPLLVLLLTAAAGTGQGALLAVACAVLDFVLFDLGASSRPVAAPGYHWTELAVHLLLTAAALGSGIIVHRRMARQITLAREREQRFAGLLQIAADWYFELDEALRFTNMTEHTEGASGLMSRPWLGRHPWELPLGLTEDDLDAMHADFEARRPIVNLIARREGPDGSVRHVSVNARPRVDHQGVFRGYWGVGRDISAEVRARQAVAASQTRYRELFRRSLSPLVLHRGGRVIDANPAALDLLGYPDLASMVGVDLAMHYDEADGSRQRVQQRIAALESLPLGQHLPETDFVLRSRSGRRLDVRGSGVRVDALGGLATLTFYVDQTGRKAIEAAVRRTQALLENVIASTPDVITLTEVASGRYAMVNDAFCRVTGYGREEVLGRTAIEIGIWRHAEDRDRMVQLLRNKGAVHGLAASFTGKNGRPLSMLISAARFEMDGRDYVVINAHDITASERTRLEYEAILQNASVGIAVTRESRFVQANARFEQLFGWPAGALVDQPGRVVWLSDEDYAEIGRHAGPKLARGEPVDLEQPMCRRDGSAFWCRLRAQAIDPSLPTQGGTIWIAEDVTERRRAAQALEQAYEAAQAASRAKSAFLANTSHEIRTPLNGLLGLARLAQDRDLPEAKRCDYIDRMVDSAEVLSTIISDILDLSKIEAGKLSIEEVPFDLPETLRLLVRAYAALAQARGLDLRLELDADTPAMVRGDPVRLRQILGNYLSNALKFTMRGEIVARVRPLQGERIRFEVQDQGPGVDAAVRDKLFQPFTQADESTTRRFGGTGLGLSICRELARLMDGEVGVISEPGRGALFWAELPLPPGTDDEEAATDFGALGGGNPMRGAHVLVVDDNHVNMMICVALLEQQGVRVAQAGDGRSALELVERVAREGDPFDAVLMDLQMPAMSGYEVTRELRRRHDARALPIIALTAAALVSEREQASAAGMNAFLTKPVEPRQLKRTLARVLSGQG